MWAPLFASLAALLLACAADATDVAVQPIGLHLGPGHDRGAITVLNQGRDSVVMQVETVAWSQADGQDQYQPSRDLLVNPPMFTLAPGRSQVLRVGLRKPPGGTRETAYRLLLREVPPPGSTRVDSGDGAGRVLVLLQMRLPVYVAPNNPVRTSSWQAVPGIEGGLRVTLRNTGNVHLVVNALALRAAGAPADSPPLATARTSIAVLAGQDHSWDLTPAGMSAGQRYTLEVTTDRGTENVALEPAVP